MFKSLLNAVVGNDGGNSTSSLIFNILIILGVVVAGALVLYLLWEVVSYMVNRTKNPAKREKREAPDLGKKEEQNSKKDHVVVVDYSIDAVPEKVETPVETVEPVVDEQNLIDESKLEEVDEDKAEEEKAEVAAENDSQEQERLERRAYLEARRQEILRRMQADMEQEEETEETEEAEAEPEVAPVEEEQEEEQEEVESTTDALADEREALNAEKARYEAMVRELEAAKQALAQQANAEPKVETRVETVVENLTLEELKARLAAAEERLRVTEKEFKQCKKEYIPLRKVWHTHEKDEKKLRRKEALVAKQKVILYGVNNYADIDEEKAKKLAEDLDLLDGLKLSVQHCEEVMKKNEERYPYLEKMYNVLKLRNDELKADIAKYRQEIERIENEENDQ